MSVDGKSLRCTRVGGQTTEQNFTTLVSLYERRLGVIHLRRIMKPPCFSRGQGDQQVNQATVDYFSSLLLEDI
jgi:hypothetical protein